MELRGCGCRCSKSTSIEILITEADFDIEQKWCGQCRRWLPVDSFHKDSYNGLKSMCNKCNYANVKKWRESKK